MRKWIVCSGWWIEQQIPRGLKSAGNGKNTRFNGTTEVVP